MLKDIDSAKKPSFRLFEDVLVLRRELCLSSFSRPSCQPGPQTCAHVWGRRTVRPDGVVTLVVNVQRDIWSRVRMEAFSCWISDVPGIRRLSHWKSHRLYMRRQKKVGEWKGDIGAVWHYTTPASFRKPRSSLPKNEPYFIHEMHLKVLLLSRGWKVNF